MTKLCKSTRWVLLLVLTALVPAGVVRAATTEQSEIVDGVAAIVNDKVITYSEVRDYVQPVVQQLGRTYSGKELVEKVRTAQMDALNNLIDRDLIIQEFSQKGYSIPATVVDGQLNDVIANDFGGDRSAFIKTLQAQRMTLAQYRDQLRDGIIVQAMRNRKTQQQVVVSPYKIEKYHQEHLDDYKVGDQIKLRMIFIKKAPMAEARSQDSEVSTNATATATNTPERTVTDATNVTGEAKVREGLATPVGAPSAPPPAGSAQSGIDPRRKLGEEILAKLDAGDSFDSMAKVYSEGKEAKEGGEWGWIGHDVLRKELNDVAFSVKPNQHSKLIETDEGYYILQVDDVKPAHTKPLTEARDEIEKILLQQQRLKMQEEWIKELRAKAYIRLF
jgi:peptidyl-prolyl cis-trans isomerase SurA